MRLIYLFGATVVLCGCVHTPPQIDDKFDSDSGQVSIYSTKDIALAQAKADLLCGHKSYYLKIAHDSNIRIMEMEYIGRPSDDYIPFQCDVRNAASGGNPEAIKQVEIMNNESYERLEKARQHQYEVHKRYAKKHGGDSYSIVNPDGSIESHSFDANGNACHSTVSEYGSSSYCD